MKLPPLIEYLVKRGLQSAEMVEHFRLGFADRDRHVTTSYGVNGFTDEIKAACG